MTLPTVSPRRGRPNIKGVAVRRAVMDNPFWSIEQIMTFADCTSVRVYEVLHEMLNGTDAYEQAAAMLHKTYHRYNRLHAQRQREAQRHG